MSDEQPSRPSRTLRRRANFVRRTSAPETPASETPTLGRSDATVGAVDSQARPIRPSSSGSSHSSHSSHSSLSSHAGSNYPARHLSPLDAPPHAATKDSRSPETSDAAGTADRQDRSTISPSLTPFGSADTLAWAASLAPYLSRNPPRPLPTRKHRWEEIPRNRFNPPTPPGSQGSSPAHSPSRVGYARRMPVCSGADENDDDRDSPYHRSRSASSSEGNESVDMPKMPEPRAQSPDSEARSAKEPSWVDPHTTRKPPWRGSRTPNPTRENADADRPSGTRTRPHIICPMTSLSDLVYIAHWLTKNPGPRDPEQMKRHAEETDRRLLGISDWAKQIEKDPERRAKREYDATWMVVGEFVEDHVACTNDSLLHRNDNYPFTRLRCATLPKPEDIGRDWRYTSDQEYADRQYFHRIEFLSEEESLCEDDSKAKEICHQLVTLVLNNPPSNPKREIIDNLMDDVRHLSAMLKEDRYNDADLAAAGMSLVKTSYELLGVSKSDDQRSTAADITTVQTAPDDTSASLEDTEPPDIQIVIRKPTA